MKKQEAYCQYLRQWADSHSSIGFEGCCPACFDEWEQSERAEITEPLTATYFLQIKYNDQNSDVFDTVALILPEAVTEADLYEEIQSMVTIYGDVRYEDEDMLELSDEMLDALTSRWGGSWNYLSVFGAMEVDGYARRFSSCQPPSWLEDLTELHH